MARNDSSDLAGTLSWVGHARRHKPVRVAVWGFRFYGTPAQTLVRLPPAARKNSLAGK